MYTDTRTESNKALEKCTAFDYSAGPPVCGAEESRDWDTRLFYLLFVT